MQPYNGAKLKAEVSLIAEEPDSIIRLSLFEVHEKQGLIPVIEKLKGKKIKVPLEVDIYQDTINYSLAYAGSPQTVDS
jgi:hypothetical protein